MRRGKLNFGRITGSSIPNQPYATLAAAALGTDAPGDRDTGAGVLGDEGVGVDFFKIVVAIRAPLLFIYGVRSCL